MKLTIKEISSMQDAVGDKIELLQKLNSEDFERPFVYINEEIIWGKLHSASIQILNDYYEKHKEEDMHKLSLAFGHYTDGCAFIESQLVGNITIEDVKDALLNQSKIKVKKIYVYNENQLNVVRLAKSQIETFEELKEYCLKKK